MHAFIMNGLPSKTVMEDAASELEIVPAFVEKDWYVTQVIKLITEFAFEDFQMIFTGGTSLSKAHHILKRFSEDIDFRVICPSLEKLNANRQRTKLSELKRAVFAHLRTAFPDLQEKNITARNGNRFFALSLEYPTRFGHADALRPHLLVEFTLASLMMPGLVLPVSSLISEVAGAPPEVAAITCVNPVENAADKVSAFVWRTMDRVRGSENDDPSIVRHLHDLSPLSSLAKAHPKFSEIVLTTLQQDDGRTEKLTGMTPRQKFSHAINALKVDPEYAKEYTRFVESMSYAGFKDMPDFASALSDFESLVKHVLDA